MDYVKKNEDILHRWEQEYIKRGHNVSFTPDGIMYRGKEDWDEANWVHTQSGKENELWANVPLRILFLTKDQNGGEDHSNWWDLRGDSYHHPDSDFEEYRLYKQYAFNTNIVNILYGLVKTIPDKMINFEDIKEQEALMLADSYPYARINCKKETGGPDCIDEVLLNAIDDYRDFLQEQIRNLDADILVCCGNNNDNNIILNSLNEFYNGKFKWIDYATWYNEEDNKLAIDLYHLSHRYYARKKMYEDAIIPYHKFIQKHPDFTKHR